LADEIGDIPVFHTVYIMTLLSLKQTISSEY